MDMQYLQGIQHCSLCQCYGINRTTCHQCHNIADDVCYQETTLQDSVTEEQYKAMICDKCFESIDDIFVYDIVEVDDISNRVIMHLKWNKEKSVKNILYPRGDENAEYNALELARDMLKLRYASEIFTRKETAS